MSVTAAVVAADMGFPAVFMIVVFTMHIGIESKIAGNKSIYRFIGITADTAVELYSVLCQHHLCTATPISTYAFTAESTPANAPWSEPLVSISSVLMTLPSSIS